jgi:hypothetical protein
MSVDYLRADQKLQMVLRDATLASKDMLRIRRRRRLALIEDFNSSISRAKPGKEYSDPTVELEF